MAKMKTQFDPNPRPAGVDLKNKIREFWFGLGAVHTSDQEGLDGERRSIVLVTDLSRQEAQQVAGTVNMNELLPDIWTAVVISHRQLDHHDVVAVERELSGFRKLEAEALSVCEGLSGTVSERQ